MLTDMVHIADSPYYAHIYGSAGMESIFNDERRSQRWLDIEAALAQAQAAAGAIPQEAADDIADKANLAHLDEQYLHEEIARHGDSILPFVNALKAVCAEASRPYVHVGPSTQDIQDTAMVLELRDAFHLIAHSLLATEAILLPLAERYADFPMAGRVCNRQSDTITLGFKFAGWAAEIRRSIERMKDLKKRLFVILMHGNTGTQLNFGNNTQATIAHLAKTLGLELPVISWANARDNLAEYQSLLAIICGTVARACNDIYQLSHSEIGELTERFGSEYVGSSTMAHKRNAERCSMNVAICRLVMNNASLAYQAMMSEHERDTRAWRLDWHSLAESSVFTERAVTKLKAILEDLDISEKHITHNIKHPTAIGTAALQVKAVGTQASQCALTDHTLFA